MLPSCFGEILCGLGSGDNLGRRYYGYPLYPTEGFCQFFVWEDFLVHEEQSTADSTFSTEPSTATKIARLKAKNCVLMEESRNHKTRAEQQANNARKAYIALFSSWLFFAFYKQLI